MLDWISNKQIGDYLKMRHLLPWRMYFFCQEKDNAPHINNANICFFFTARYCWVVFFFFFFRNKDYTWAVWLRRSPVAPTLCISNISVWCVISQMWLDSLKLSSGNWIGHGLGQRSATGNFFFFFRVRSEELCCFRKWFPWMSSVLTPGWSQHRWGRHYSSVDLAVCWSVKQSLK